MIDDRDSAQLSEYCFNVRKVLKAVAQERNADSSVTTALEDLERCANCSCFVCSLISLINSRVIHETEWTLKRGENIPRTKRNHGKVQERKHKTQEIPDPLDVPSAPLDETISMDPIPESGAPLPPPSLSSYRVPTPPLSQL